MILGFFSVSYVQYDIIFQDSFIFGSTKIQLFLPKKRYCPSWWQSCFVIADATARGAAAAAAPAGWTQAER